MDTRSSDIRGKSRARKMLHILLVIVMLAVALLAALVLRFYASDPGSAEVRGSALGPGSEERGALPARTRYLIPIVEWTMDDTEVQVKLYFGPSDWYKVRVGFLPDGSIMLPVSESAPE